METDEGQKNADGGGKGGDTGGNEGAASGSAIDGGGTRVGGCPTTVTPKVIGTRVARARDLRKAVADITARLPQPRHETNGEEGTYPNYPYQANYTKALPKRADVGGRADVVEADYRKYLAVLNDALANRPANFCDIPFPAGGKRKQTNPQSGIAFDLEGYDPHSVNLHFLFRNTSPNRLSSLRPAPRIDGLDPSGGGAGADHENAAEMIELYWMALVRDLHFRDYAPGGRLQSPPPGWPENPGGPTLIDQAVADLDRNDVKNAFDQTAPYPITAGHVTHDTIFRGSAPGDEEGPFISQFLLRGSTVRDGVDGSVIMRPENGMIPHGAQSMNQRQLTVVPYVDYLLDLSSWRAVEDGTEDPTGTDDFDEETLRFIRNLRDLGNWVHVDYLYQHFLNAALILLNEPPLMPEGPSVAGLGLRAADARDRSPKTAGMPPPPFPFDPGNPYEMPGPANMNSCNGENQIGFATFGDPHVLTLLAEVTTRALKACWFQKWYVHRRDRPEEFGGLVHFQQPYYNPATGKFTGGPYPCVDPFLFMSPALSLIHRRNSIGFTGVATYLLPQVFPEGSPTHPAYPSGHATAAGACATILKAFFKEDAPMTDPTNNDPAARPTDPSKLPVAFEADLMGTGLVRARRQAVLTVEGELNKLASNIAIGRDGAGVHWRSDATEGMKLGESVAMGILFEQAFTFNEEHSLSFNSFFTRERVTIGRRRNAAGRFEVFVRIAALGPQAVAPQEQTYPTP